MTINHKQRQSLTYALIIVLIFTAYFLRHYISIIALAAIAAFLFSPIYGWLFRNTRKKAGLSITVTLLIAFIIVAIPVAIVLTLTVNEAFQLADLIKRTIASGTSAGDLIQSSVTAVNHTIDKLPGHIQHISSAQVFDWLRNNTSGIIKSAFKYISSFAGGFASYITRAVIFIFFFISFLVHQDKWLQTIRKLNPLEEKTADLYLSRAGAMTSAMVKGQFTIALLQGLVDAGLLWITGIHYFIFWFVVITFISIVPLGGGILVIPAGLIMLFTGHIWQGLLLILGHIIIVTNLDNVLRPHFVPKSARLDPALIILSIFAGIAMFGFLGIVIGPVLMILVVTTVQAYLAAEDEKDLSLSVGQTEDKF